MTIDEAKQLLSKYIQSDKKLKHYFPYVGWRPYSSIIVLDGIFTSDELEAIAVYTRYENRQLRNGEKERP